MRAMLCAIVHKQVFQFAFAARTSRGPMRDKTSWFIRLWDDTKPEVYGLGECGPLPYLSKELTPEFENVVTEFVNGIHAKKLSLPVQGWRDMNALRDFFDSNKVSREHSSVTFALETALLDLFNGGARSIFINKFTEKNPIPINGLVWMGGL